MECVIAGFDLAGTAKLLRSLAAAAFAWFCTCAYAGAEEPAAPLFSAGGFGTFGVVHASEHQADFGANAFKPEGAGYTHSWSPEVDSRLGLQVMGNFTPDLSATVQVIAEQRQDGSYQPHVEWANVKYQVSPQFSLRIGRTALASFLVSDFRKVGYINPWVRPPEEVYGLVPIFSSDGVDASYRLQFGEVSHTLLGGFGRTQTKLSGGGVAKSRHQWTLSDTVEAGPLTLRAAYQKSIVRIDSLDPLFAGLRQFGAQGVALADRYDPNGRKITFFALGGSYDPGDWFVMAELGRSNLHSVFGKRTVAYATAGYRIREFTPYITYARSWANSNRSDPGLTLTGLPPELAVPAAGLNSALNAVLGLIAVQQSVSGGARWDFMKNVALKLQYDRMNLGAGSAGVLGNVQPGFRPGGNVHIFSATVDFVW